MCIKLREGEHGFSASDVHVYIVAQCVVTGTPTMTNMSTEHFLVQDNGKTSPQTGTHVNGMRFLSYEF